MPRKRQENYAKKETIMMIFRQALPQEINSIFSEDYKEWSKNRTEVAHSYGKIDAY